MVRQESEDIGINPPGYAGRSYFEGHDTDYSQIARIQH